MQLDPASLGKVSVTLAHGDPGGPRVVVAAERPDTLQLLQQDRPALQHALDLAGLPSQGRELSFGLLAAEPSAPAGALGGNDGTAARDGSTGDGGRHGSDAGSGRGSADAGGAGGGARDGPRNPAARWLRAGIDITA